jgi:hypothetical protein
MRHLLIGAKWVLPVSAALLTALTSCSSLDGTFVGDKSPDAKDAGILFRLSKPVFTLTRVASTDATKTPGYQLAVTYEPNASQSFRIRYSPGFLSDSAFGVKLANGSLTGVNATATDQVVPTMTALATFTSNLIGSLAKLALEKSEIKDQFTKKIKEEAARPGTTCKNAAADSIVRQTEKFSSDEEFVGGFHWLTVDERNCLVETLAHFDPDPVKQEKVYRDGYLKEKKTLLDKDPTQVAWTDQIDAAITKKDMKALDVIEANLVEGTPGFGERSDVLAAAKQLIPVSTDSGVAKALKSFIDMKAKVWRRRHLLYLEREIDDLSLEAIRSQTDRSKEILDLMQAQAETIGAIAEYKEIGTLNTLMQSLRSRADRKDVTALTVNEFVKAQEALEAVTKAFDAKRTKVLEEGKAATPPVEVPPPSIVTLLPKVPQGAEVNSTSPEFVLILEKVQ